MSSDAQAVFDRIDADELIKVALDLANIDSPTGREGPVADYVYDWLRREGLEARKVALYPDRPNVIATLPGSGGGRSLCFNSHMDTAVHQEEWWANRHACDPIFHSAWREGRHAGWQRHRQRQGADGHLAACRQGDQGQRAFA